MPFKSMKQRRYLFAYKPELAKRWAKKYGTKIRRRTKRKKGRRRK